MGSAWNIYITIFVELFYSQLYENTFMLFEVRTWWLRTLFIKWEHGNIQLLSWTRSNLKWEGSPRWNLQALYWNELLVSVHPQYVWIMINIRASWFVKTLSILVCSKSFISDAKHLINIYSINMSSSKYMVKTIKTPIGW